MYEIVDPEPKPNKAFSNEAFTELKPDIVCSILPAEKHLVH